MGKRREPNGRMGKQPEQNSVYLSVIWTSPGLPTWCAMVKRKKKKGNGGSQETSIPTLAPLVLSGAILEMSFSPSSPHLKSELITLHSHKVSRPPHSLLLCLLPHCTHTVEGEIMEIR